MRRKAHKAASLPRHEQAVDDIMKQKAAFAIPLRRLVLGIALALGAALTATGGAEAQLVAVIVNGDPITNYDVEQRTKLIQLSTHKSPPRKEVLEELIEEKLKIQLLRRYNIEGIDKDVDNAFANMARRMRATPKQFTENLAREGIVADTIKSRIKGELIWSQVIRGRFQSSFQFSEKDVLARLETQRGDGGAAPSIGHDYTLRPILFVVPRGSPRSTFEERRKEAEAFRGRFQSCEQGIPIARALPYVAVRPPVVKSSAELAPALREILEKTELGGVTAPEITLQGVEIYALCGKKQSDAEKDPAKREVREQMFKEQFDALSKRFMSELRSQAMIEQR
jgi:peptidyl-prolyl cis-trans isomerase SurA